MNLGCFYPVEVGVEAELLVRVWGLTATDYASTIEELPRGDLRGRNGRGDSMLFAEIIRERGLSRHSQSLMMKSYLAQQHTKGLRQGQWGCSANWESAAAGRKTSPWRITLTVGRLAIGFEPRIPARSVGVIGAGTSRQRRAAARTRRGGHQAAGCEEWFEVMRRSWTEDL